MSKSTISTFQLFEMFPMPESARGNVIDLGNDGPPPVTCPNECAYCGEPCEGEYCSEEHAEHRSMY